MAATMKLTLTFVLLLSGLVVFGDAKKTCDVVCIQGGNITCDNYPGQTLDGCDCRCAPKNGKGCVLHLNSGSTTKCLAHHIVQNMLGSDANRARQVFSAPTTAHEPPHQALVASWFQNPPVVFSEGHQARFQHGLEADTEGQESYVQGNFPVAEDSDGLLHGGVALQDEDDDEDISSQPLPPYVGMVFDTIENAKKFYNDYAFKLGFDTRICSSRNNHKKGAPNLTRRVFECVHARKQSDKLDTSSTSESIATEISNSGRQASVEMDVTRTRQK